MSEVTVTFEPNENPLFKIISLQGEMDEPSLGNIQKNIEPILNDNNIKFVIFKLNNLNYINSKGIGYIMASFIHLSKNQRKLILCEATEAVMDVISLVGLTSIIPHFNSLEEALQVS